MAHIPVYDLIIGLFYLLLGASILLLHRHYPIGRSKSVMIPITRPPLVPRHSPTLGHDFDLEKHSVDAKTLTSTAAPPSPKKEDAQNL